MRIRSFLLAVLVAFVLLVLKTPLQVSSQAFSNGVGDAQSDLNQKLQDNRAQQAATQKLLDQAAQQESTLNNEIVYQDNQIKLTNLKIEETQSEIQDLGGHINQLEGVLSDLSARFAAQAAQTYRLKRMGGTFALLVSSGSASDFIARFHYLETIQESDRTLLLQMQTSQSNYEIQKTKVEQLQAQLDQQNALLASQKLQKQNLLKATQNDEKKYQALLASLRADEAAIENALSSLIAQIVAGIATGSPVTKGQIIGQEGNTGYVFPRPSSTCPQCGYHLHFMILPCNVLTQGMGCYVDPSPYLDNTSYNKPLDFPSGNWRDYVTQGFGYTTFALSGAYGGAPHSGIDLQTKSYADPVYAVANGTVYYGTDGAGAHYALLKVNDNLWAAYWHLK